MKRLKADMNRKKPMFVRFETFENSFIPHIRAPSDLNSVRKPSKATESFRPVSSKKISRKKVRKPTNTTTTSTTTTTTTTTTTVKPKVKPKRKPNNKKKKKLLSPVSRFKENQRSSVRFIVASSPTVSNSRPKLKSNKPKPKPIKLTANKPNKRTDVKPKSKVKSQNNRIKVKPKSTKKKSENI